MDLAIAKAMAMEREGGSFICVKEKIKYVSRSVTNLEPTSSESHSLTVIYSFIFFLPQRSRVMFHFTATNSFY